MKAVVVYESMYGNTHHIADAIGEGLRQFADVVVVPADEAESTLLEGVDLLVVGGPTHVHGMSRVSTRKAAIAAAHKPTSDLTVDPGAEGPGLRDWFAMLGPIPTSAAAFDTRLDASPFLTGRASKGIARQLRRHGCSMIADPESFLVSKANRLQPDEETRARNWGTLLGATVAGPSDRGRVSPAR